MKTKNLGWLHPFTGNKASKLPFLMVLTTLAGLLEWLCIQASQYPRITITIQKQHNEDLYDAVNHGKKTPAEECLHANQKSECFCGALNAVAEMRLGCVEFLRLAPRQWWNFFNLELKVRPQETTACSVLALNRWSAQCVETFQPQFCEKAAQSASWPAAEERQKTKKVGSKQVFDSCFRWNGWKMKKLLSLKASLRKRATTVSSSPRPSCLILETTRAWLATSWPRGAARPPPWWSTVRWQTPHKENSQFFSKDRLPAATLAQQLTPNTG